MADRIKHPSFENAFLYKQIGSKNWFVDYINANGKRERKSTKTDDQVLAMKKLTELSSIALAVRSGVVDLYVKNEETIEKAIDYTIKVFLNENNILLRTRKRYVSELRNFKDFSKESNLKYLKDIKPDHLRNFLNHNYSPTVLQCNRTALTKLFDLSYENRWLDRPVVLPKVSKKKGEAREALSAEPYRQLIGMVVERLSAFET